MEPLAVAGIVSIAGAAVLAVVIGAMSGAVAWRVRHGLVLGGLLGIGAYLLVLAIDGGLHSLRGAAVFGGLWATVAALASALVIGYLYLLWFRFGLLRSSPWEPLWIAVGVDACLLVVAIRSRSLVLD